MNDMAFLDPLKVDGSSFMYFFYLHVHDTKNERRSNE